MEFNVVKQIIDSWDPVDLLAHAAKDEYDRESKLIFERMKNAGNEYELGEIIYTMD